MIELTPLDVRKKKGDFRRGLRGYEPGQVDDFLDVAADRLEALVREAAELKERVARLEQQVTDYRDREKALTEALVTAQQMREDIRSQSSKEVELLLRKAEQDAEGIRAGAERAREREEGRLGELRNRQVQFLASYRKYLETELAELAAMKRALDMHAGESADEPGAEAWPEGPGSQTAAAAPPPPRRGSAAPDRPESPTAATTTPQRRPPGGPPETARPAAGPAPSGVASGLPAAGTPPRAAPATAPGRRAAPAAAPRPRDGQAPARTRGPAAAEGRKPDGDDEDAALDRVLARWGEMDDAGPEPPEPTSEILLSDADVVESAGDAELFTEPAGGSDKGPVLLDVEPDPQRDPVVDELLDRELLAALGQADEADHALLDLDKAFGHEAGERETPAPEPAAAGDSEEQEPEGAPAGEAEAAAEPAPTETDSRKPVEAGSATAPERPIDPSVAFGEEPEFESASAPGTAAEKPTGEPRAGVDWDEDPGAEFAANASAAAERGAAGPGADEDDLIDLDQYRSLKAADPPVASGDGTPLTLHPLFFEQDPPEAAGPRASRDGDPQGDGHDRRSSPGDG